MAEVTIKRSAADLHIGSPDRAPSIQELVDRVIAIAGATPTDLVDFMATVAGGALARVAVVEAEGTDPDRFLRSWNSIGHASPCELTGTQYQRFLQGDYPLAAESTVQAFALYGAGIKTAE